jgi:hypothetical protein
MEKPTSSYAEALGKLYRDLDITGDSAGIRVLDLHPGAGTKLRATLRVVSLNAKPQYEALSYTWGARGSTVVILNDNCPASTTNNLANALRRLRRRSGKRTLWVDAICINQADTAERSRQVALMGRIYSNAWYVNVWLGDPGFLFLSESAVSWMGFAAYLNLVRIVEMICDGYCSEDTTSR